MLPFDGMRGIAAIGVVAFHMNPASPFTFWTWTFVDMFFVLSGFLIGTILYRGISEGTLSLKNFWMRRILRIWPVYYLVLVLVSVWALSSSVMHLPLKALLQSLFFLQFTGAYFHLGISWESVHWQFIPWFDHSWSIAVEEQFYFLLPMLLWLFGTRARSIFLMVIVALVASQFMLHKGFIPTLLGTRMQGLALGLLLVPLSQWLEHSSADAKPARRPFVLMVFAGSFVAGLYTVVPFFMQIFPILQKGMTVDPELISHFQISAVLGMPLVYFAIVGFVLARPQGGLARVFSTPVLVYLGSISYALYMIHVPVAGLFMAWRGRALSEESLFICLAYWAAILGLAVLSKIFIESRFNALKDRYPVFIKPA